MNEKDAVVVVEFSPASDAEIDAVCILADAFAGRILAIAQEISPTRHPYLRASFDHLENIDVRVVGAPLGRGAAIRLGLQHVTETYVAILNLDFGVDVAQISNLLRELDAEPTLDGLFAYRNRLPWYSGLFNFSAGALLNLRTSDVQAPLKIFRARALNEIVNRLQLFNAAFDVDLVYRARKAGLRIRETSIVGSPRPATWPVFSIGARAFAAVIALRLLESRFGGHPLVLRLGRPFVLTQKASYSILVFCWRDPNSPKAGGGEVYLHEQARCWVEQGHRVTWVAQQFNGAPVRETLHGIEIVRCGRSLFVFPFAAAWYVFQSGWRFDFILDVMNGVPFFTPLFSSKPKACLLYHVHSHHFRQELPWPLSDLAVAIETKLVPFIYRRTRFLTISESSAAEMRELKITRLPLEIIHSGVSDDMRPGTKHSAPTILYLGRLRRYKGVRKLIDAFSVIKRTIPNARLVIAGTGDDELSLRTYAAGLDDVIFAGLVDDQTKVRLYQEAWVFGMPSTLEGWGIVVIEAARCATPAIAFDVNGLRDCILDGETGLLARDDDAFRRGLQSLLIDADLRKRLAENAIAWGNQYSWSRTASRTLQQIRRAQPWNAVFAKDSATELPIFPHDTRDSTLQTKIDHRT